MIVIIIIIIIVNNGNNNKYFIQVIWTNVMDTFESGRKDTLVNSITLKANLIF